jgi:hypothetical protein
MTANLSLRSGLKAKSPSLTPNTSRRPFGCRSEALTKAFLLTPRDTDVPGAREIPKQVFWRQNILPPKRQ